MKKVILGLVFPTTFTILSTIVIVNVIPAFAANNPYLACPDCNDNGNVQERYGIDIVKGAGTSENADCVGTKSCFSPNPLKVTPDSTVMWKNKDTQSHTVTSGKVTYNIAGSLYDSGLIRPGDTFQFTYNDPGTYDYFCTVHPWMTGQVIVGNGNPPNPQAIMITTDKPSYNPGNLVTIAIQLPTFQQGQTVAIMVDDPSGNIISSRTVTLSQNSSDIQIGLPQNAQIGTYQAIATSSSSGTIYKGSDEFMVLPDSNPLPSQVTIISVSPTDQQGNFISSFGKGTTGYAKVVLSSKLSSSTLVTVNLVDADLTSLGVGSIKTTLTTGQTEIVISYSIPKDATTGTAHIYADVFSDWLSNSGIPLTAESSSTVEIG